MLSVKHTSQEYYNSHAKEREQLSELQHVWYKKDPVAHWQRGSVVQVADTPKSYVVQDDSGARYQRNSRHVRSTTVPEDPSDATPLVEPDRSKDVPRTFTETGDIITRSGRNIFSLRTTTVRGVRDPIRPQPVPDQRKTCVSNRLLTCGRTLTEYYDRR
ncbi:hypothetical protein CAPTEDRAFT_205373 [Capitella teleta]|uniref:Uncharacterized protein n=1 Tax=Capitella teleta TaxID=283909 RepID=R7TTT9_CAPTE|nr:hypothetical protein CAPTEDRAFT_205373 [Capitella teleta]|eukprot:ELT94871.1 hypothetical protein CAPTEDRAFT_205373 [Capitella teleta]